MFYDLSSSSCYGSHCPLAVRCHNRDGLKLPAIAYGLLTDDGGRPVAMSVYPGNTGDPATVPDQVESLRRRFGIGRFVLVGDRGMLTSAQIGQLRQREGCGWISCLRSGDIRKLLESRGQTDAPLFDQRNLAELSHPDFPGERLIACFNQLLFVEENLALASATRDPVAKATATESAQEKKNSRQSENGFPVRHFNGLLSALATLCSNTCRVGEGRQAARFQRSTEAGAYQREAFRLLNVKVP